MEFAALILCFTLIPRIFADPWHKKETLLKTELMSQYEASVAPLTSASENISVSIGMSLLAVQELNIVTDMLHTSIWLRMGWQDERLAWDTDRYGGIDTMRLMLTSVWTPDITPYNTALEFFYNGHYQVVVHNSGYVLFVPHLHLTTDCQADLTWFPYDIQICKITMGSWTYHGNMVSLDDGILDMTQYKENNIWEIVTYKSELKSAVFICCPEPYQNYTVELTLRRRKSVITNLYTIPAACISLIIPAIFMLPPNSCHKILLGSALLVAHLLLLESVTEVIPISHFTVPRLGLYYVSNIVLIVLSLALSSVVIWCHERAKRGSPGVPPVIDQVFLGLFGRMLRIKREDFMSQDDTAMTTDQDQSSMNDQAGIIKEYARLVAPAEWRQLSAVLDRLLFGIFLVVPIGIIIGLLAYSAH